jgi:hypothetical protein
MLRTLFADEYLTVTLDAENHVVRFTRNDKRFPSIDAVRAQHVSLDSAVAGIALKGLSLLVDVRSAPPRNDEAFESEITRLVARLVTKFKKHAFLVQTAVGGLQVRRLATSSGAPSAVTFSREAEALAYLTGEEKPG